MVKHVILWQFKDELSSEERNERGAAMKAALEGLKGVVPGLKDIVVRLEKLESSNADIMLESTHEDEEALKTYANHPKHVEIAQTMVVPYVKLRVCMDYNE